MGAGNSTMSNAINDITNRTINNISTDIKSSCIIDSTNKQAVEINLNKISGCALNITGISQSISATSTLDCKNSNIDQTSLENTLKNNLDASAKTLKDSPFFSFGDQAVANSINKSLNEITNEVTVKKLAESILRSLNDQNIAINISEYKCFPYKDKNGNIKGTELNIGDINQDIVNNVVLNSLTENKTIVDAITSIDNEMKSKAESTSLGLSIWALMMIIPIIIFFVFLFLGIKMISGVFNKASNNVSKTIIELNKQQHRFGSINSSKMPLYIFVVFSIVAIIMFIYTCIQINMLSNVSKKLFIYIGMLIAFTLFSIMTTIAIILYAKTRSASYMGLSIAGIIISIGIGLTVISLAQLEINEIQNTINEFKGGSNQF